MARIIADYCFERDVESDFTTRRVEVLAVFFVDDEQSAYIRRADGEGGWFGVAVRDLTNLRVVE